MEHKTKTLKIEITIKGRRFSFEKKCTVEKETPYYREDLNRAVEGAIEKIVDDNQLDVFQIDTLSYGDSNCDYSKNTGEVIGITLHDIKIKMKNGKSYSLKEWSNDVRIETL